LVDGEPAFGVEGVIYMDINTNKLYVAIDSAGAFAIFNPLPSV